MSAEPVALDERLAIDEVGLGDTDVASEEAFELGIGSRMVPLTTQYAEAFEVCEYGRRVTEEQIKKLFPFYE